MLKFLLVAVWLSLSFEHGHSVARPNIVFILADDFGYNDIGYHAQEHSSDMKTPCLDQLASEGIKLENYYVQPICTPTRSQLMSGRYQIHTGLQHSWLTNSQPNGLPLDNIILPEQLRSCGYDTHMVGKWHLGDFKKEYLPWNRGFNSYFGYLTGGEDYNTKSVCWENECGVDMWSSKYGPVNDTWGQYSTHLFADKAREAVDNRDPSKPFFLYLAFQSVHSPMQAPEEYVKPFSHIKDKNRRIYGGMVSAMDEAIFNVTVHLEAAGLKDNTIIIFSTDNGGQTLAGGNNWPLRGRKTTLWEGGVKGVGFIHGKPLGLKGRVHNQLMHVSDWLPTIISASACPILNGTQSLDGFDQWKSILQNKTTKRNEILLNIDPLYSPIELKLSRAKVNGFDTSVHAGIRSGPWKLLTGDPGFDKWVPPPESNITFESINEYPSKAVQLFHIETDPYEYKDLSDKFPDVVARLLDKLVEYNKTAVPVNYPPSDPRSYPKYHGGFWGPWL